MAVTIATIDDTQQLDSLIKGGGGGGGGGVWTSLIFFEKLFSEIAIDQQTRTREQTFNSCEF